VLKGGVLLFYLELSRVVFCNKKSTVWKVGMLQIRGYCS